MSHSKMELGRSAESSSSRGILVWKIAAVRHAGVPLTRNYRLLLLHYSHYSQRS